jgi:hypothetical protein
VKVLERMMATGTTAGPLEYNGEIHIASSNVYDLADPVHAPRFKSNVPDAHIPQPLDNLSSFLGGRDPSCHTESFYRQPFLSYLLPKRQLKTKLSGVDVERVEGNADACRNLGLYLCDFGVE